MKREYPYDANNYSFIASNHDNVANLRVEQTNDLKHSDLPTLFSLKPIWT